MKKKILIGIVAVLLIMQFFRIDKSIPEHDPATNIIAINQPDAEITHILKVACYDCHSYDTEYPWYTNVAPLSFLIKEHIKQGRKHLNFAEWASYDDKKRKHKLEECIEEVEGGRIPMKSYTWLHAEAKLTDEQREKLVAWFQSAIK